MDTDSRLRRRVQFDAHPESYERARPGYSDRTVADLLALAGITPQSRVLEIGCGPGTLTQSLAPIGCEIIALELGPHLADAARRKLAGFRRAQVITSSFEDWPLPERPFDVVVAAGSFHWIDPDVGVSKVVAALKPFGRFAAVNRHRIRGDNEDFEKDVRECYLRWDPSADPDYHHPDATEVKPEIDVIRADDRFASHETRSFREDDRFTTSRYRDLLNTYSDYLLMEASAREGLAECLCSLLDTKYGGVFVMPLLSTVYVAQKSG